MLEEPGVYPNRDKCFITGLDSTRVWCGKGVCERIFWNLRGLREQKLSKFEEKQSNKGTR